MTNSISDLSMAEVLLLVGSNTTTAHPVIAMSLNPALQRGMKLIVVDPRRTSLARRADIHLRLNPGTDVALLKAMMRVIVDEGLHDENFIAGRVEGFDTLRHSLEELTLEQAASVCGLPAQQIAEAARLYAAAGRSAIAYCLGVTQHSHGTDNVRCVANLAMLTGNIGRAGTGVNPLRGANNVQGCCDMGGLPDLLPGYQRVDDKAARARFEAFWKTSLDSEPGLTVTEMLDACLCRDIRAMYIMGENPVISDPDASHVRESLERLDFLAVQDIFLTETAQLADVVLPGATFAEKDGTFTNTERRVQRVHKAIEPPHDARPDWLIIRDIANGMGAGWQYESPKDIMDEVREAVTQYGGIRYGRIEKQGIQWPCPKDSHPGTTILHAESFACGKGKMAAIDFIEPGELPDGEYPLIFNTGRALYHFHTGSMTRRAHGLDELMPSPQVDVSTADAQRLGIREGDMITVTSRRGMITAEALVSDRCAEGSVFMPFHFAEAAANLLTSTARDPVCKIPELKICAVRVEKAHLS